jgi:NCAIR mutase (PurE)-related protein
MLVASSVMVASECFHLFESCGIRVHNGMKVGRAAAARLAAVKATSLMRAAAVTPWVAVGR